MPDEYKPQTDHAVGFAADLCVRAENARNRKLVNGPRRVLAEFVIGGRSGTAPDFATPHR
jgi:hypothetical protein